MAETMGAEDRESRICSDALDDEGYVLGYPSSTGVVAKCAAGAKAYGIAFMSTKNPVTGVATANMPVAIVRKPKKAKVQYRVASTDSSIAIGDLVSTKGVGAAGYVKKHVSTAWPGTWNGTTAETISDEDAMIVGIALEAVTAPGSSYITGKIEVLLLCPIPIKQ